MFCGTPVRMAPKLVVSWPCSSKNGLLLKMPMDRYVLNTLLVYLHFPIDADSPQEMKNTIQPKVVQMAWKST